MVARQRNYNLGHNILELYNVLVQIRLTTSKTKRDIKDVRIFLVISSTANLVYELSHDLLKDVRLRIQENKEILGKSQIWVET